MILANSYVALEKEFCTHNNDYDTLLEKNQELANKLTKLQKIAQSVNAANPQLQQQNLSLQRQV